MNRRTVLFSMLGLCFKPYNPHLKSGDMVTIVCEGPYKGQLNSFKKKPYRLIAIKPSRDYKYENPKVQAIYGHESIAIIQMDNSKCHIPLSLVKRA